MAGPPECHDGETRAAEFLLATLMISMGLVLIWPGETFALPHYRLLNQSIGGVGESAIGAVLVLVGAMRWAGLLINGNWRRSPLLRLAGCCLGSAFWAGLALTILEAPWSSPPWILAVAGTCLSFEVFSGARCGVDAFNQDSLGERRRARLAQRRP